MLHSLKKLSRFYSVFRLARTNNMNQNKCYFRYILSDEKVDISFLFKVNDNMRQFNLSRNPTEKLEVLLSRMGTNLEKVLNKGNKKKKVDKQNEKVSIEVYDEQRGKIFQDTNCLELFSLPGPVKLLINENVYEAVFNAPWIVNISLPQSILAGFPVYPEHFNAHYTDKEKSVFNWYSGKAINDKGGIISEQHIQWKLVGEGLCYTPTVADIGFKLKLECIPANDTTQGPAVETISNSVIEAGPGKCPFETRHMFTTTKLQNKSFRCVTYNILADLYCDSDYTREVLHPYCPAYALHIDYRKQLILKELLGYNADIICMQEVDQKVFRHCLLPILENEKLIGLFYKKGKEVAEGLSLFYRQDRFNFVSESHIVLAEALKNELCLEPIWSVIKDNKPLVERLLDRSTVASVTVLESVENPTEILVVGNTHLYFHPDSDHIRLIQGGIVIYWLSHLKKQIMAEHPNKRVSVMICGDFNSVPSCGIYKLYTTGVAPSSLPDWSSNQEEAVKNLQLQQNMQLGSACGTPQFTNFTAGFADCLDYIFYEKSNLDVEQVVPLPSVEELQAHTALPSIVFPSDHIALISDLTFK